MTASLQPGAAWKWVQGWEGLYAVDACGGVYSAMYSRSKSENWRRIRPSLNTAGYEVVCLARNGVRKMERVHRLVAKAFIPNPKGREHINHKNFNRTDNRESNLEWVSIQENNRHTVVACRHPHLNTHGSKKITLQDAREIVKTRRNTKTPFWKIGKMFGISQSQVHRICIGENWCEKEAKHD